jgi:hypothetical protein
MKTEAFPLEIEPLAGERKRADNRDEKQSRSDEEVDEPSGV